MSLALYMDEHVPFAITQGLRQIGIDVLTAQDDHTETLDDPDLLSRARDLNRVLFTLDQDFSKVTARWLKIGNPFSGVIILRKTKIAFRQCLDELELICRAYEPHEIQDRLEYLPLG